MIFMEQNFLLSIKFYRTLHTMVVTDNNKVKTCMPSVHFFPNEYFGIINQTEILCENCPRVAIECRHTTAKKCKRKIAIKC